GPDHQPVRIGQQYRRHRGTPDRATPAPCRSLTPHCELAYGGCAGRTYDVRGSPGLASGGVVHKSRSLFLSLGVSLILAASLQAIVYIVPSDRDLVRRANAIVVATAIESHAELTSQGRVVTATQIQIEDVLKGTLARTELRLVEPGGIMSEHVTFFYGSPVFEMGKRYLLFLTNAGGEWTSYGWQIGQF